MTGSLAVHYSGIAIGVEDEQVAKNLHCVTRRFLDFTSWKSSAVGQVVVMLTYEEPRVSPVALSFPSSWRSQCGCP
jgi:hypothetical protein